MSSSSTSPRTPTSSATWRPTPAHAATRNELRDRLLDLVILQDYPHTHRDLFALGVH